MKPLTPTPYELGRDAADKQEAALVKQAIADRAADKQRIRELETALKPFAELDTVGEADNNHVKRYVLIADVRRAAAILKGAK